MVAPADNYGVEVWCFDQIVPGKFARGWRVVAQAIYRRLTTPRGKLRDGDDGAAYGLDLSEYVGQAGYPTAVNTLPGIVAAEIRKDDRVASVDVEAAIARAENGDVSITLDLSVTLEDGESSFDLTLDVSTGGVTLLFAEAA
jgi:hypothetical protein